MMDPEIVKSVSAQIYRQYPEMKGTKPKVRSRTAAAGEKGFAVGSNTYLLTFSVQARTSDGKNLPRSVRVVATENGKILKVSTSH